MNRKVFLSYSWKDLKVAMRLYDDLVRSHIEVWRDQIDGDPTTDFLQEFLSKIDECDDFIILDSENYRLKSNWCITELERCFDNRKRRNGPRIIVCLLDKDGEWRTIFRNDKQREVFSKINLYKYHTLYYEGMYDNNDIYQQSVADICALFSKRYIPWNCLPPNRDLIEELINSPAKIMDDDKMIILNGYEYIARLITLHRDVNKHFELWISDCNQYELNLFFPRWTYCVWLGHDLHNGKYNLKCYFEFERLSREFPNDPRCYRGLGCIAARLGKNQVAINAFTTALKLMKLQCNDWHRQHSEIEVLSNLSQVLINSGKLEEAINVLYRFVLLLKERNDFILTPILNLSYCLLATNQVEKCKELLLDLLQTHKLESELYEELGYVYSEESNNSEALQCFKQAYMLMPSIKNAFNLMCRESIIKDVRKDVYEILSIESRCEDDDYWKGAMCYYILGDIITAKKFYDKCGTSYDWYC